MSSYMLLPLLLVNRRDRVNFYTDHWAHAGSLTRPEYDLYTNIAVQP